VYFDKLLQNLIEHKVSGLWMYALYVTRKPQPNPVQSVGALYVALA
jgi:hypothetical protein